MGNIILYYYIMVKSSVNVPSKIQYNLLKTFNSFQVKSRNALTLTHDKLNPLNLESEKFSGTKNNAASLNVSFMDNNSTTSARFVLRARNKSARKCKSGKFRVTYTRGPSMFEGQV